MATPRVPVLSVVQRRTARRIVEEFKAGSSVRVLRDRYGLTANSILELIRIVMRGTR
jgi:Mor family transcriptional regulator